MTGQNQLISYDPSGVFLDEYGITRDQFAALTQRLNEAREEVSVEDARLFRQPASIPEKKQPLDAGFYPLPEQLLKEYRQAGAASELGRILATAARLGELVDRVVVLGIGGSYMGARAVMDALCAPYFNELDRALRGSRPRVYFAGNNLDNDATQGLLSLLQSGSATGSVPSGWAVVVISKSGGTLETAVAFRQFLAALRESCHDDPAELRTRVVPVTGTSGKLFQLAQALECPEVFHVPDGVGGRFSVLCPVGLLPAAVLGLNIVRLLEGAAAMNEHFRTAPVGQNAVLDYVGVCHLMETLRGATIRVLNVWSTALESVGLWYDQLLAESLGKKDGGATPITAVNTRDLHSRAQQHQQGRRDKIHTNLIVDQWRTDPLPVGSSELNQDQLNDLADKTLPDLMAAAVAGTNQAYQHGGRPTADVHLPSVDEYSLGQFFQMMMLATVVEGRLIHVNPYGQPGVEGYKRNMADILGRT